MADNPNYVDPEELREELLELAEVIRRLDEDGELLDAAPELIKIFGNLRSQLFEYEVRHTKRLFGDVKDPPEVVEAQRIVHEAARNLDDEDEEWWRRFSSEPDEREDR
jgi:hypothetical protein